MSGKSIEERYTRIEKCPRTKVCVFVCLDDGGGGCMRMIKATKYNQIAPIEHETEEARKNKFETKDWTIFVRRNQLSMCD